MTDEFSLRGMHALITGSTQGIGEAIARAYSAAGATCIVHGRNHDRAREIAEEIGGIPVAADLSEPGACEILMKAVRDLGSLDVLVNNAGYEVAAPITDLTEQTLQDLLSVNFIAPATLMRLAIPFLRASANPSIVNVTSIHETVPVASNGGYAAAKAALASLSRTASIELGPLGIRVNTLAPGAVLTAMNRDLIAEIGDDMFRSWIPLGRVGTTSEIASVAVFLASRAARYISGTSIVADGAYSNHLVRYPSTPEG